MMPIMMRVGLLTMLLYSMTASGASPLAEQKPIGDREGLFPYRFERGNLGYCDVLRLADGAQYTGKVLEWANQILVYDAAGHVAAHDLSTVSMFETRRSDRHQSRPMLPDLTVAYVERLPRDPSWHGHVRIKDGGIGLDIDPEKIHWHPKAGASVHFRVHVLNAGASDSAEVPIRALIDGREIHKTHFSALHPGQERVVEFSWLWQEGQHSLIVEIDPDGSSSESLKWNNRFVEPIRALAVTVVVDRKRYEAFKTLANMVDSFCFEDYIQYHIRNMNALFAASVYPSAPNGILERVRCDRILVVDNPMDPEVHKRWLASVHSDGRMNGLAEYSARLILGTLSPDEDLHYDALKMNWKLLQQIGLQIGLIDLTKTDTTLQQCYVLDKNERFAQRRYLSRWMRTIMYSDQGFPFSEPGACFLNHTLDRPRGIQGDYLFQLPKQITLEVLSNAGRPLSRVQVDVFQLSSAGDGPPRIMGIGRHDPLISAVTDERGLASLANRPAPAYKTRGGYELGPNPFGHIAADGSNGLLLLRLRSGTSEEFHFLPILKCNIAYLRGAREKWIERIPTRFAADDAPPSPSYAAAHMDDRSSDKPPLTISWRLPKNYDATLIEEFRIYRRTSFAGDELKPWTLVSIKPVKEGNWKLSESETYFEEFTYDGPYTLDSFFAVTTVDKRGRESNLSEPAYIPYHRRCVHFAVEGMSAYMTVRGDGLAQMFYWDGTAGTQPFGVKTDRYAGYRPGFSGIAFTPEHRLMVTDPVNHVLAIYDQQRHELQRVIPDRSTWPGQPSNQPGEFFDPADIAIDDNGTMYVADRGNNRVQILDRRGRFKALLDEDFRFRGPHAVGYANGYLCVTDMKGTRCRVYKVIDDPPNYVRQLPPLVDAGRGLVNKSGKIFITARQSKEDDWTVLVYAPSAHSATFLETRTSGQMGNYFRPRSLYLYRGLDNRYAYFANDFPFDVRRVKLEKE